jgi:hypothetical protein
MVMFGAPRGRLSTKVIFATLGLVACRPGPGPTPGPEPGPPGPGTGPSGGPVGACDVRYTAADYAASPRRSDGVDPGLSSGPRPTFVASTSTASGPVTYAVAGRENGGTELHRGLLLNFDESGTLRFGHSFSHCAQDEVESVAVFDDGSLAASTTYVTGETIRTDLIKVSASGEVVWRHLLAEDSCRRASCFTNVHSEIEIDHKDESVVAAVQGTTDDLVMVRVAADGRELRRRVLTPEATEIPGQTLASLAIYEEPRTTAYSEVLVGLRQQAMLLTATFDKRWVQPVSGAGHVEVAMCDRERFTFLAVGFEFMSNEHVVSGYSKAGSRLFGWRVAGDPSAGTPAYGVARGDLFNLGCHEQKVPELVMRKSDGASENNRDIVGLMLLHDGTIHRIFDARLPEGAAIAGSAGVGLGADALLARQDGKFRMIPFAAVGWTPR